MPDGELSPRPARSLANNVNGEILSAVRQALADVGDPDRAPHQQAYMRSAMPFRGVSAPILRVTLRPILADPAYRLGTREEWEATVRALWDDAAYREERYAAVAVTGHRHYRGWQDAQAVALYRHLIETGAWWDFVDEIASRRIGPILRASPQPEAARMRRWARDEHLWVRRTAILSQLGSKGDTDLDLLTECIDANLGNREFFINKAIGWALRQYAHVGTQAGEWVRGLVAARGDRLAPLSRREALKHL